MPAGLGGDGAREGREGLRVRGGRGGVVERGEQGLLALELGGHEATRQVFEGASEQGAVVRDHEGVRAGTHVVESLEVCGLLGQFGQGGGKACAQLAAAALG